MADELNYKINAELEFNEKDAAKKLEAAAKRLNMTGKDLLKELNLEVKVDMLDISNIANEIYKISKAARDAKMDLQELFKVNPSAKSGLFSTIKSNLNLVPEDALSGLRAVNTKSRKPVGIQDEMSRIMFGETGVKFEIAAFKKEITSREKKYVEDFGNEAIDFVDLIADDSEQLILKLNQAAKEAAKEAGVKFVGASEAFTQFNDLTLEDDADKLIGALRLLAEGISLTGSHIAGGERVLGESLTPLINDFVVNKKGTFTVSPAMALDAYYKAIENIGLNLVTQSKDVKKTSKQRNFMEPGTFQEVFEKQAPDNVVAYLKNQLESLASKKDGSSKLAAKMSSIEEFVFQQIFDAAQKAAEGALKDKKTFDKKQLDIYAPSADIEAIGGSADARDKENLMRYAEEAAAKAAHETELKLGVQPGTFAKYASTVISKKFQEFFTELESNPNALFDPAKTLGAIRNKSFIDNSGSAVSPATSALANVKPLFDQILENPAIIEKLIGTDSSALAKKSAAFLKQKLDSLGKDLPSDPKELDSLMSYLVEVSRMLAFVQSFVDQTKRIKPINNKDLLAQRLTPVDKSGKPIVEPVRSLRAKEYPNSDYTEIKKSNKEYGEKLAKEIAIYRNKLKEAYYVSPDELDAQVEEFEKQGGLRLKTPSIKTQEDVALYTRQREYNKRVGEQRARQLAIRREAERAAVVAQPAIPVSMQAPAGQKPVTLSWKDNLRNKLKMQLDALGDQSSTFAVAIDTEFNKKIDGQITELSAVFKDINGGMHDLLTFIHLPFESSGLATDRSPFGAKSVKDLKARAEKLNFPADKLGDLEDPVKNKELLYRKAKSLTDLFDVLTELNIPITGSNLVGAEVPSINAFIKYVNTFAESIGQGQLPMPDFEKLIGFDSSKEFAKINPLDPIRVDTALTASKKSISSGLQPIVDMIGRKFPEFLAEFSDVIRMTENGPVVRALKAEKGKQPSSLPAHYAQADAVMSLIVKEFFMRFAPAGQSTNVIPVTKTQGAGGGGRPPVVPPTASAADDPMGERKAGALARAFHSQFEYTKMLSGLTKDEKEVIQKRLALLQSNDKQIAISAALLEKESAVAEKRAYIAKRVEEGKRAKKDDPTNTSAGLGVDEYKAIREEIKALDAQIIELNAEGRKQEQTIKDEVLAVTRLKGVKEELLDNDRKGIDLEIQKNQAGKQFAAQTKANLKAELEAQKAVQRANKDQINQWVTARYALYDVGNFYTNIYQQMFRLSRQLFDTTRSYRNFETAFTSVERAMQLSGTSAIAMRDQFIKMSEELPVTFEELTKIATLGAQMGIGASGIQSFTENIAEFAAVTGISADTVAQKFGRIAELAKVDSSDFDKLGSAVAYAGVNAVATESEILNLSEAIAAVSTNVGFTPQEVIGLSTALASVGVQAEQARGVFTRVFADIDRAVSKGGPSLEAFAKASGMSSEAFAQAWGKDGKAGEVFRQFLGGLGSSANITKTFDSLNIVESREINTLTRLAKSLDVVDQAMSDANSSYAEGKFLGDSFEKTVDNLDAKLVIFKNNLDSVAAAFSGGFGIGLKTIVDSGSEFLKFIKGASGAVTAQAFLPIASAVVAIGGASALAVSGVTKLVAQIYAFRVAQIQSMNKGATEVTTFSDRIKHLSGAYSGLIEMRSKLHGIRGAETQRGEVVPVTFAPYKEIAAQVKGTLKWDLARTVELSRQKQLLEGQSNIYMVAAGGFAKRSVEDARKQADAVQRFIEQLKVKAESIAFTAAPGNDPAQQARRALLLQELMTEKMLISVKGDQVRAISQVEYAKLLEAKATKTLTAADRELLTTIIAVNAQTETGVTAQQKWGSKILNSISAVTAWGGAIFGVISIVDMLINAINSANDIKFLEGGGGVESLRSAIEQDTKAWKENGEAITTVSVQYDDLSGKTNQVATSSATIKNVNGELVTVLDKTTDKIKSQTVAIGNNTKEWMLNAVVGNEKVNEWLKSNPTLFNDAESALKGYGTSFSDVMKTMLSDPKNGQENALNKVNGALEKNKQALIARARELVKLNPSGTYGDMLKDPAYQALLRRENAIKKLLQLIPQMSGALGQALNTSGFVNSMKAALGITEDFDNAITNTTASVKTLTQWAGEVGQVMQSAFDIRYGKLIALDNVRKSWSDLKKRVDDAKKAIKKAQDQMNSLKATKGVLEYQLGVALRYGDSKRAAEIQAKLAENSTSLAEAADQEAEANKNASMELRDGSDAAIQNRAALLGLLQTYIPLIQAVENSTVKGETFAQKQVRVAKEVDNLKAQFIAQAKEIGFADKDLASYAGTFETFKGVIKGIKNTITVKVDGLNEAARALKEFASTASTILGGIAPGGKAMAKIAALAEITQKETLLEGYKSLLKSATTNAEKLRYVNIVDRIGFTLKTMREKYEADFATGGYVSGPGTGTSDSIKANLSNGEFVMSAKSVSTYGVDFMNALNQSKVLYNTTPMQQSQAQGGTSLVYLSPDDRALLRAAIDRPVNLYADSTRLAQSVNNGNKILAQRGTI